VDVAEDLADALGRGRLRRAEGPAGSGGRHVCRVASSAGVGTPITVTPAEAGVHAEPEPRSGGSEGEAQCESRLETQKAASLRAWKPQLQRLENPARSMR
jgi:hypothetical protein